MLPDEGTGGGGPAKPQTILLLGSFAPSLVRFRGALIADIVSRGHRLIAAAPAIDDQTATELRELGAEPREVPLVNASLNPLAIARSYRRLRALVGEIRPDVLMSYTIKPVILGALAGRAEKVPRIVSLITGVGYAFTGGHEPRRLLSRLAATPLYRLALGKSDIVIFQNPDDEALFRKLGLVRDGQRVARVNGSGIDLDRFRPAPRPAAPALLMVARLLKDKGIREFAAASRRLKRACPEARIELVGYLDPSPDSLRQEELDSLVAEGIEFSGRLDDVRPAIERCSIYVLPSYREGTPRSVLEAMAMGRAIITSDAPGCRETVIDDDNGLLVTPRDSDALFEAMLKLVRDPALVARMGERSRQLAEQRFDVRRVNEELIGHAGL